MEKSHSNDMKKSLDIAQSKINALEAGSDDKYQRSVMGVLKVLVENQKHLVDEFEHLKKAIDLLTLQIFKVEGRLDSKQ